MTIFVVWIALLALTAAEAGLAFANTASSIMLTALIGLSAVKAALIMGWFMLLRLERRALALAIVPPAIVVILVLAAGLLPDAHGVLVLAR